MDFVGDALSDGRAFRALALIDAYTRECPVVEVDVSLGGTRLVALLERLRVTRGLPERITVDNGPESRSRALNAWPHQHGLQLQLSRSGKPADNTFIEAFSGRLRDECRSQHWFLSLADTRRIAEHRRIGYNAARPHRALAGRTPPRFAEPLLKLVYFTQLSAQDWTEIETTRRGRGRCSTGASR
jgi:putative transposase